MTRARVMAIAIAVASVTGCSEDVQLGIALGGGGDASLGVGGFVGGAYTLTYDTSVTALCNGTLAGSESMFEGQSLADLGLATADVTLTLLSEELVRLGGAGLQSSFKRTVLDLVRTSVGSGGEYEWFSFVDDDFGAGPVATTQVQRTLNFAEPIESPPRANVTLRYETATQESSCELFLRARLVP